MKTLKIVTQEGCTQCDMTKTLLKNKDVEYEIVDVDSNEGQDYVTVFNIEKLPCIIEETIDTYGDTMIIKVCEGYEGALKVYGNI